MCLLSAVIIALELALSEPIPVGPGAPSPLAGISEDCAGDAAASLRRRVGHRLVVRMGGKASTALRRQASRGEIGGVILFPAAGTDPASLRAEVASLQEAAAATGGPPLIVAIDQEGGEVKRLAELPPDLAPPQIAARGPEAAREQGLAAGGALARLGVNVDLAPVLDVPATPASFIASRSLGSSPAEVADNGTAFATGLAERGVAATAKHFPGLGRSAVNTDLAPSEIDVSRARLFADLAPFERSIEAGIGLVMLSNAVYPPLDPELPAFASPAVAGGLLRDELGFAGVTITDDLEAGAVRARFDRASAARAAIAAGSDLLLFAQTPRPDVLDELVRDAERGRIDSAQLEESCGRVLSFRNSLTGESS